MSLSKAETIRPIVLCLFRHNDHILVHSFNNPHGNAFYRPLGGGIEYGEYAVDALRREMREELSVEIINPRYLFTLENIFDGHGLKGHEIALVFDAQFADAALYQCAQLVVTEGHLEEIAVWKAIGDLRQPASPPLYPDGLLEHL